MYTSIPVQIPPAPRCRDREKEYSKVQLEKRMKKDRRAEPLSLEEEEMEEKEESQAAPANTSRGSATRVVKPRSSFPRDRGKRFRQTAFKTHGARSMLKTSRHWDGRGIIYPATHVTSAASRLSGSPSPPSNRERPQKEGNEVHTGTALQASNSATWPSPISPDVTRSMCIDWVHQGTHPGFPLSTSIQTKATSDAPEKKSHFVVALPVNTATPGETRRRVAWITVLSKSRVKCDFNLGEDKGVRAARGVRREAEILARLQGLLLVSEQGKRFNDRRFGPINRHAQTTHRERKRQ
ncbi:hypothetical protein K438DRAFT_2045045 [Mycena galopus ATCC 62051]|nr:hypothetical protein K438DRAFT_2045045 [Mycena galopus ATCC 62051]